MLKGAHCQPIKVFEKNNALLMHYVSKERDRNLGSLLDQTQKRDKSKRLRNLSQKGFDVHVNHRYQLADGRIGICRYKGRTEFGKTSEDWIGIVVEVGCGEHDGTVDGKTYFRCREGAGVMVRPWDIIKDLGASNKALNKMDIELAKKEIKRKRNLTKITTSSLLNENDSLLNNNNNNEYKEEYYEMLEEKTFNPITILHKNKLKKPDKKARHFEI